MEELMQQAQMVKVVNEYQRLDNELDFSFHMSSIEENRN